MTNRSLALKLLRDAGPRGVTTGEFLNAGAGNRFSARLKELRDQGHPITAKRIRNGSWRYFLNASVPAAHNPPPLGATPTEAQNGERSKGRDNEPFALYRDFTTPEGLARGWVRGPVLA